jgi:carbonic anhydrase/acetyltransferase-like protein (isoleucine patch superfamily)/ABC-type branched-subunit amino acid transport system substrate-binding protein
MIGEILGFTPRVPPSAFVAPDAVVLGDVHLGENASVWYGAVLRGDAGPIRVGARTNIQDHCVLHATTGQSSLTIGDEVTVGHRVILHGAVVRDRCLIGMGAILLDDCEIGEESLVAAGAVILGGMRVPPRSFVAGMPARVRGPIPPEAHARLRESADVYVALAREHARRVIASLIIAAAFLVAGPAAESRAQTPVAGSPSDSLRAAAPSAAPASPASGARERRYPSRRSAELKARLLEAPPTASAPAWALEFATSPDVQRLEPEARAAEQLWAARIGLASQPDGSQQKELWSIVERYEGCLLDSVAIKRAALGLTKIGVVVPLSGRYERYGKTFVNGLRVALEEHNRDFAPSLSLVLYDSEGDPFITARKARWLLMDHGVSLLIGELFTANTAPLASATQVVGAVLLSPSASNERLATLGEAVFQLHVPPAALASALARHLKATSPKDQVGIIVNATPDDAASLKLVTDACKTAGVTVAGVQRITDSMVDLTTNITALARKKARTIVLIGDARLVGIAAPQIAQLLPDAKVVGFESMDPDGLLREAKQSLEGASFFVSDYALLGGARDSFALRYEKVHHEKPTRMSVRGYLVGLAVTRAVESGCVNASGLTEALRNQLYDGDEGRVLHALKPAVPAEPERLVVRKGKAIAAAP